MWRERERERRGVVGFCLFRIIIVITTWLCLGGMGKLGMGMGLIHLLLYWW